VFTSHLTEVKRCIAPIYRRLEENRTVWHEVGRLYNLIERTKQLIEKWHERVGPGEGGNLVRFEQKFARVETWFNETVQSIAQQTERWKGMPVRAKQIADKFTELNTEVGFMKAKFGGARMPRLMKGDGSEPSDKEWSRLNEMAFMKNMRGLDMDEEMTVTEGEELDL
jgi:hypothetical protein